MHRDHILALLAWGSFFVGVLLGSCATVEDCKAQTVGVSLASAHEAGGYERYTPGIYVRSNSGGEQFGVLRNSIGRWSVHASQVWETSGSSVRWALQAGIITGYPESDIFPLVTGSVLLADRYRLAVIPGPHERRAVHFALEFKR
jgi:hypothetical protein